MPEPAGATPKKLKFAPWLAVALILAILAAAIWGSMRHLRQVIIEQIALQDGYVLYAASKVQVDPDLASDPELRPIAIESQALEAARLLTNIIALRLYDTAGQLQFVFPHNVKQAELSRIDFAAASDLRLSSQYQEAVNLGTLVEALPADYAAPLLRVLVPLEFENTLIGIAEFWMDGRNVKAAVAALNRDLWRYGLIIFVIGGAIIAGSLGWVFARLQRSNRLLAERTESLLRANHELTMAAKTSAVGAIAAHLIHDLKSPLFGLQNFVQSKGIDGRNENDDWSLAIDTTKRMQKVINDVVRILQEEKTSAEYEITTEELLSLLRGKIEPQARQAGLSFATRGNAPAALSNRDANILLLILSNLADNAVQATPQGGSITVTVEKTSGDLVFEVADTGPGLPPRLLETLFTPSRSGKSGGTGLGLAISKQLANHLGAELKLKETSSQGTIFQLRVAERSLAKVAEFVSG